VDVLREARAGEVGELQRAEEVARERVVLLELVDEHGVPRRDVEVVRRRDLAQVRERLRKPSGQGPALVDVERAAEAQHAAEHDVAAHHVMPGQPVHLHHRSRRALRDDLGRHLLGGGKHAVRHHDGLGHARRARGEHVLGRQVGCERVVTGVCVFGDRRLQRACEADRTVGHVVDRDDLPRRQGDLGQRTCEPPAVLREDESRPGEGDRAAQARERAFRGGVRGRHRRHRDARVLRRPRDERLLDRVFRQHHQRPLLRAAGGAQHAGQAAHRGQRLAPGDRAPAAGRVPLREQRCIRLARGPMAQPGQHRLRMLRDWRGRAQQQGAAIAKLHVDGGWVETRGEVRCVHGQLQGLVIEPPF
jgi:hypothetical protein